MRPTLVFRMRHVSHARDARGIRRCEALRVFVSGVSILAMGICMILCIRIEKNCHAVMFEKGWPHRKATLSCSLCRANPHSTSEILFRLLIWGILRGLGKYLSLLKFLIGILFPWCLHVTIPRHSHIGCCRDFRSRYWCAVTILCTIWAYPRLEFLPGVTGFVGVFLKSQKCRLIMRIEPTKLSVVPVLLPTEPEQDPTDVQRDKAHF
jgi:hypothetical protein